MGGESCPTAANDNWPRQLASTNPHFWMATDERTWGLSAPGKDIGITENAALMISLHDALSQLDAAMHSNASKMGTYEMRPRR